MGMNTTYQFTSVIWVTVSATFGQSYAITKVSPLNWVQTDWKRKLARTVIGFVILAGIWAL